MSMYRSSGTAGGAEESTPRTQESFQEKKDNALKKVFDFDLNSRRYLLRTRCLTQATWKGIFNLSRIYHVDDEEKPVTVCDLKMRPLNP